MSLFFTWDLREAEANARKHGLSFAEAATAFGDPHSLAIPDPDHSMDEDRYVLMGTTAGERLVVVVHTWRGETVRLICARRATRRERRC